MKIRLREKIILISVLALLTIGSSAFGQVLLRQATKCTFTFVASDTTKTCTLGSEFWNTELHGYIVVIPNFAATSPTATFSILNPAGQTMYTIPALAESSTSAYTPLSRPLTFGSSYVILLTTTAGTGGGTATVDSWVYK